MAQLLISDEAWQKLEPILPKQKNRHVQYAGRKPSDFRLIFNCIVFALQTGIPWRRLPKTEAFPSGFTCRRWLQKWQEGGVWNRFSKILLSDLRKKRNLKLHYAAIDSSSVRAPSGGAKTGPNPTDRSKRGTKHHIITDAQGLPLVVLLTGANRHDSTQLIPLIEHLPSIAGKRGRPIRKAQASLC